MRKPLLLIIVSVAIIAVTVLWLRPATPLKTDTTSLSAQAPPQSITQPATVAANDTPAASNVEPLPGPPPIQTPEATYEPTDTFRVDSSGKLILDEQTRLAMEALFASTDPAELPEAQQELLQKLPPSAAAQAAALLEQYENYSKAQRQAYPPGVAPATEEAALAELDGLHALRVAHFGADVAQALYGAEETLARSLIELMRLEKNEGLTMEEKAARAQQLYDTLPELSRVPRSD